MIDLNKLIRYIDMKKREGINDNLARVILYLGQTGGDTFKSMADKQVIPKGTRNFRDLSRQASEIIYSKRQGHPAQYYANLTERGKRIFKELSEM